MLAYFSLKIEICGMSRIESGRSQPDAVWTSNPGVAASLKPSFFFNRVRILFAVAMISREGEARSRAIFTLLIWDPLDDD
jgi:hypothetical protein